MKAVIVKSLIIAAGGLSRGSLGLGLRGALTYGCRIVHRVDASPNVSLTFDDSPDPDTTPLLLDALARHAVKATFFVVGKRIRKHPDIFRRIVAEGHEIGNHTEEHPNLQKVLPATLRKEIVDCQETIAEFGGQRPKLFRAPYGLFRSDMRYVQKPAGIEHLLGWDVTPHISEVDPNLIAADVLKRARRGSIILLHDGLIGASPALSLAVGRGVAESLHKIIPALLDRGIRIVPAGEQIADMAAFEPAGA